MLSRIAIRLYGSDPAIKQAFASRFCRLSPVAYSPFRPHEGNILGARNTYHDYATRIEIICEEFRSAITRNAGVPELVRITTPASDLLKILGVSLRNDDDYDPPDRPKQRVGSILKGAAVTKPSTFRRTYSPPFSAIQNASPLHIRDAFNKISHADPSDASYYIDNDNYEIIVCGKGIGKNGQPWLAIISLPTLLSAVKSLPDKSVINAA